MSKSGNIDEMNESSSSNVNCPSSPSFLPSSSPRSSSPPPSSPQRQHKRRRVRIPQILLESTFRIEERAPSCLASSTAYPPQQQQQHHDRQSQSTTSLDVAASSASASTNSATTTAVAASASEAATAPYNGRLLPFPYRLHFMLDDVAKRGKQHIVSWTPCGTMFHIHNPSRLVKDVIPTYFNMTQYKSFSRQLLNYGFTRVGAFTMQRNGLFHSFFFLFVCLFVWFWVWEHNQSVYLQQICTYTHPPILVYLSNTELTRYLIFPPAICSLCCE